MAAQTVAELLIAIGVDVDGADKAEKKIEKVTKSAGKTKSKGGADLKKFAGTAKVAFAAAGAAALAAAAVVVKLGKEIFNFVDETTAGLDKIAKDAKKSGLGTEEFQRLGFAAERSGTNVDTLAKGTRRLGVQFQDVAAGGGKIFTDALADIGLGVEDIEGKSATEQLGILGDALNGVTDKAERAALASRLLGEESGPQLLPLLQEGSEGIDALSESATGIIPEESLEKAEAFQDVMTDFNGVINEIKASIAVDLIPVVEMFVAEFRGWIEENQEFIRQKLPELIKTAADAMIKLIPPVVEVIDAMLNLNDNIKDLDEELTQKFGPAWTGVKAILKGITAVFKAMLNPIDAIGRALSFVIDKIVTFVQKSEALLSLARRLGVTAFDPKEEEATTRGTAVGDETREEGEARRAAEIQAKEDAKKASDFAAKTLALNEQNVARTKAAVGRVVAKGAKGRKFRKNEKAQLAAQGFSNAEISAMEKRNRGSRGGGGGGGGGRRTPTEVPEEAAPLRALTATEQFLQGKGIEVRQLKQVRIKEEDIKPQSVINITNNAFDIDIEVEGVSDPLRAANEVGKSIKREFDRRLSQAAQSGQSNVVR